MSDFTLLTLEQFGEIGKEDNKLDLIKKRGGYSVATDYSVLLVGINDYWLRTIEKIEMNDFTCTIFNAFGSSSSDNLDIILGVRPVLPLSSVEKEKIINQKQAEDGILEIEYGYYPQNIASKDMQERLERIFENGNLKSTGNVYTILEEGNEYGTFKPKKNIEYSYDGKRYVRVKSKLQGEDDLNTKFSNGEYYNGEDFLWVEVLPVRWIGSKEDGLMITEKNILTGIPFVDNNDLNALKGLDDDQDVDEETFRKTTIGKFMDEYLSKEMFQVRELGKQELNKNTNPYGLDFNEVDEEDIIREAIRANVSVFLHGKPGCGKSDRVKQLDPDFIELNLSHLDPELLDGLAGEKDGKAVHIKPPWLEELEAKCKEEKDKIHILFLEELTNASPVMQAKAYGIALDKKVAGRWKLPENARVVAAGNELEDSLAANEMAEPLYDRFAHVNIETDVDSWLKWAVTPESTYERLDYEKENKSRPKIHPSIYAYISCNGDRVLRTKYDRENPAPHADPRRWKMASDMLYASNNPNTLRAIVGEDLTKEFIEFCKMPTISIEDVINENYTNEDLQMNLGKKFATIAGLVQVDEKNMPKVREFVRKLGPEMLKKFEVQWAHGNEERLEQLQELEMEEKLEHSQGEARKTAGAGVLAFEKIDREYQRYLSRGERESK